MPITIYGAGAIGGLAGAYLAKSGEDVVLVDKMAEHVDAINAHGLRITGAAEFTVPVRACRSEDLRGLAIERGARPRGLHNLDELERQRQDLYGPGIGPR